jgi:hypothetical protein
MSNRVDGIGAGVFEVILFAGEPTAGNFCPPKKIMTHGQVDSTGFN